jgi:hypothetical protein
MRRLFLLSILFAGAWFVSGCAASPEPPAVAEPITDASYLTADLWNDGQAEVTFYEVERTRNQYGEDVPQSFLVGSYLVKHDFDPEAMAKAGRGAEVRVPAFKYALFYEFESRSYQFKRSYVTNAAQADLTPLKASFTSFDWCSNQYRELAFHPGGEVTMLMRSDDYGNREGRFRYRSNAYPVALVPMLVRALDFTAQPERAFTVALEDGRFVGVVARLGGVETLEMPGGPVEAERITLVYDESVPSPVGEETDREETYWRGVGPDRLLLRLEGASGRYRMTLLEHVRSPYWRENLYTRLSRVTTRP